MTPPKAKQRPEEGPLAGETVYDYFYRIRVENQALKEELERYRAALNNIASWKEGSKVTGTFDEPESARIARKALSAHEENL